MVYLGNLLHICDDSRSIPLHSQSLLVQVFDILVVIGDLLDEAVFLFGELAKFSRPLAVRQNSFRIRFDFERVLRMRYRLWVHIHDAAAGVDVRQELRFADGANPGLREFLGSLSLVFFAVTCQFQGWRPFRIKLFPAVVDVEIVKIHLHRGVSGEFWAPLL